MVLAFYEIYFILKFYNFVVKLKKNWLVLILIPDKREMSRGLSVNHNFPHWQYTSAVLIIDKCIG